MIKIIGDVHGKYNEYIEICNKCDYSIQIGDTGYKNHIIGENLDTNKHKWFTGNHQRHDIDYDLPGNLGRFGYTTLNNISFFFVSGGFSLDQEMRKRHFAITGQKTWFENEELSYREGMECLALYEQVKPDIVLSHEPIRTIANIIGNPDILKSFGYDPETFTTSTGELLQQMWNIHKPKVWISGHMHVSRRIHRKMFGTNFVCLKELETFDLNS